MQNVFPALRITNYRQARAYYVDGLGFSIDWEWRHEPHFPVFMQLSREDLSFYLSEHEGDGTPGARVHLYVPDVDAWHSRARKAGLPVDQPPTDQPWGVRDLILRDPDGNRLCVGTRLDEEA